MHTIPNRTKPSPRTRIAQAALALVLVGALAGFWGDHAAASSSGQMIVGTGATPMCGAVAASCN